jgi:serine/threonine protein kinase
LTDKDDPLVGRVLLGRYRVVRRLAKGGMGVVYLARTEGAAGFVKPVVIKRILPDSEDKELVGMFVREARILSNLRHPNIAAIVDFAEEDNAHLMVLEYVHGFDLLQWRRYVRGVRGNFDCELALHIVSQVLEALAHAHRIERPDGTIASVIHRDISLSNVLIDAEGHVKIIDFGVARMQGGDTGLYKTATSMVKGKIPYVPPEQLSGAPPTSASDVYSCGVLLHDLLMGKSELRGKDLSETVRRVLTHVPSPVRSIRDDVPPAVDDILARAMSKDPATRFSTAEELNAALREVKTLTVHEARSRLAAQAREDFAAMPAALKLEPLEDRERSWRRPVEELEPPSLPPPKTEVIAPPAEPPIPTAEVARPSRAWAFALGGGLVIVGAAIVLAAWMIGGDRGSPGEQVFIVQEGSGEEPRSTDVPPDDAPDEETVAPDEHVAPMVVDDPVAPPEKAPPRARSSDFGAAFARHRAPVEACLRAHAAEIEGAPELAVHFTLERDGTVREARVQPPALAGTPLGACLRDVAREVRFGEQPREAVSFRIPITVNRR